MLNGFFIFIKKIYKCFVFIKLIITFVQVIKTNQKNGYILP